MPATWESISSQTSSASTSITFNSFSGYTDLILVISGANSGSCVKSIRFNGSTSNYKIIAGYGYGATLLGAGNYTTGYLDVINAGTNPYTTIVHIFDYANPYIAKGYISTHASGSGSVEIIGGTWNDTAAITSFDVVASANNFGSSTFSLYGIKEA